MGASQEVTTTGPANKNVTKTLDQLLGGVQDAWKTGPAVFNSSLYGGVGGNTQGSWSSALTAANNPNYSSSIQGAIDSLGKTASGQNFGMNDPGYAALRQNAINDTQSTVNQQFNNSGRFGGGTHVGALGEGIAKTTAGLDYANFQNDQQRQTQAAQLLPGLFQSSLMPSQVQGQVGAAQDANTQATLLGNNDLFRRQNDAKIDLLAKLSSIFGGTSGAGGTTTTAPGTPWWQSALGLGIGAAGAFL